MIEQVPQAVLNVIAEMADEANNRNLLKVYAKHLSQIYESDVELAGSALFKDDPRDWDVRITLEDDKFAERFGDVQQWIDEGDTGQWTQLRWGWSDECVQQTEVGWKMTLLNIDFQIYPRSFVQREYANLPTALLAQYET